MTRFERGRRTGGVLLAMVLPGWLTAVGKPSPFGDHTVVIGPQTDLAEVRDFLAELNARQAHAEFSDERWAILFQPGTYAIDVTVDYYMQVAGLGMMPDDVTIEGVVQSTTTTRNNNVTVMFWRAVENLHLVPGAAHEGQVFWAVSQAAPFRRMYVEGDLWLDREGWASGGLIANSIIEGTAGLRTGQQWFSRNSEIGGWIGGNWNATFVGVKGAPESTWPSPPVTIVEAAPILREKPFLVYDGDATEPWAVFIPSLQRKACGVSWKVGKESGARIPLDRFYIAHPEADTAETLNTALRAGKHLLFTPGIYPLEEAIEVERAGTVVLGLGLATLVPQRGEPAMRTADAAGIILAGLVVDAGPVESPSLIEIGPPGSSAGSLADICLSIEKIVKVSLK